MASFILPLIMSTVLAVMMAVLGAVGFLYYKKRKDGKVFQSILEPMTRAKSKSIIKKNSIAKKNSIHKKNSIVNKQVPVMRDTQFWVPEVYSSIIQPNQTPPRKVSRMQSTLDREIYSRTPDTSYLEASESEVFENESTGRRRSSLANTRQKGKQAARRIASADYRGMLNFNLQYKHDRGLLLVLVVKAENLPPRKDGECVDPFVDVQLLPYYKRRMHSEVHQKTQNPAFNQCFEFEVPPYEIREQQIQFTVLDFSQQLDHSTIGTVVFDIISLDNDALRAGKEFSLWKRIDKMEEVTRKNALLVQSPREVEIALDTASMLISISLNYLRVAERLSVTVNKARNLPLADRKGRLDHHYVSVALRKQGKTTIKKQRTSIVKHDPNPVFTKCLTFDIPKSQIETCTLIVKLRHHSDIGRDRTFALLSIGHNAQGSEAEHWTDMLDSGETVTRWHRMVRIEPVHNNNDYEPED